MGLAGAAGAAEEAGAAGAADEAGAAGAADEAAGALEAEPPQAVTASSMQSANDSAMYFLMNTTPYKSVFGVLARRPKRVLRRTAVLVCHGSCVLLRWGCL